MTECLALKNLTVRAADSLVAYQLCLHKWLVSPPLSNPHVIISSS